MKGTDNALSRKMDRWIRQGGLPLGHLLGIGLLYQGTPELITRVGVAVDELAVDRGQPVIDDHVHPLPEAPEVEVEDASIGLGLLGIPLLLLPVGDDLWTWVEIGRVTQRWPKESSWMGCWEQTLPIL